MISESQTLKEVLDALSALLIEQGVAPETAPTAGLGLLFAAATLTVLALVYGLVRFAGSKKKQPIAESPEAETHEPSEAVSEQAEVPEVEAVAQEPQPPVAEELAEEPEEKVSSGPQVEKEQAEPELPSEPGPAPEVSRPGLQEPPAPAAEVAPEAAPAPPSFFERLKAGLSKTQSGLVGRIDSLLRGAKKVDEDLLEELEEVLITSDIGMKMTRELISALQVKLSRNELASMEALRSELKAQMRTRLQKDASDFEFAKASPFVIMVVGVNGVGKTTTIGKLAHQFSRQGKKVVLGAGDTFRAAAADQLGIWAKRAGVELVRHDEGADPAAVAFDAAKAAVARKADVLLLDTAGRLHTKVNLMEELKKVRRVLAREIPGAPHETLLVLDATTGQNALSQAKLFGEAVEVTGVALTKLDGTAKGGIVVAIGGEYSLPVRYVGIGEGIEDLRPFDPDQFVDALFERNSEK